MFKKPKISVWWATIIFFFIFPVLVLIVGLCERQISRYRIDSHIEKLKEQGYPISIAEVKLKNNKIKAENNKVKDLIAAIKLIIEWETKSIPEDRRKDYYPISTAQANSTRMGMPMGMGMGMPTRISAPLPEKYRTKIPEDWEEKNDATLVICGASEIKDELNKYQMKAAKDYLSDNAKALKQIEKILYRQDKYQNLSYINESDIYENLWKADELIGLYGIVMGQEGQYIEAVKAVEMKFLLANTLNGATNIYIISEGNEMRNTAVRLANQLFKICDFNKEHLDKLGKIINEGYDNIQGYQQGLIAEQARIIDEKDDILSTSNLFEDDFFELSTLREIDYKFEGKYEDFYNALLILEKKIKIAGMDYPENIKETKLLGKSKIISKYPYRYSSGFFNEYPEHCRRYETILSLGKMTVTIEKYKLKYNKLPTESENLVGEFIEKIPVDQYDGKKLKYIQLSEGKGYIIYSVGDNQRDDGGKRGYDILIHDFYN
ncbi:MAG: hypothetical protein JEZ07_12080 [Phycisphaerae bacterium]|nr:hypothetical protein [Phycisphaerae bacterium]